MAHTSHVRTRVAEEEEHYCVRDALGDGVGSSFNVVQPLSQPAFGLEGNVDSQTGSQFSPLFASVESGVPQLYSTGATIATSCGGEKSAVGTLLDVRSPFPGDYNVFPMTRRGVDNLPDLVPNLTRRSRGRRVARVDDITASPSAVAARKYACPVEQCGM